MEFAYISLSSASSVPDPIYLAVDALQASFGDCKVSSLYRTIDKNGSNQLYYNLCLFFQTNLAPKTLKKRLNRLELYLGRDPNTPRGQHRIDIDLLLLGQEVIREENFHLPHLDLMDCEHVIRPLLELSPELIHPETGQPLRQILISLV